MTTQKQMTFKQNSTGKLTQAQHTIIKLQEKLRLMQKQDSEFSTVQKDLAKMRDWEEMSTNEFADVHFEELVDTKSNKIFKQLGPKGVKIKEPEFINLQRVVLFMKGQINNTSKTLSFGAGRLGERLEAHPNSTTTLAIDARSWEGTNSKTKGLYIQLDNGGNFKSGWKCHTYVPSPTAAAHRPRKLGAMLRSRRQVNTSRGRLAH